MENFDLPLPDDTYEHLKAARHDAIASYAAEAAGTVLDLDADLEAAGVEHLIGKGRNRSKAAKSTGQTGSRPGS